YLILHFGNAGAALTRSNNSDRFMPDPSIAIAEAFNQFFQATVSALHAYEQGTRARLSQT
ncbi:hypothetical protein BJV78DRAFT_1255072, partial [Lactifluus subvellereus]